MSSLQTSTCSGLNPRSCCSSLRRLRTKSPATISKLSDTITCPLTNSLPAAKRPVRRVTVPVLRALCLRDEFRSMHAERNAGARPKAIPVSRDRASVNASTRASGFRLKGSAAAPPKTRFQSKRVAQKASSTAQTREQHTFGEQLPDEPCPGSTHGEPHRHLPLPCAGTRQQQVRRVEASDK